MSAPTEAQLAHLEIIARRLVIGQLEGVRDREISIGATATALQDMLKDGDLEDILQVVWFLSFFAAAGMMGEAVGDDDLDCIAAAIKANQVRINYLAGIGGIS